LVAVKPPVLDHLGRLPPKNGVDANWGGGGWGVIFCKNKCEGANGRLLPGRTRGVGQKFGSAKERRKRTASGGPRHRDKTTRGGNGAKKRVITHPIYEESTEVCKAQGRNKEEAPPGGRWGEWVGVQKVGAQLLQWDKTNEARR